VTGSSVEVRAYAGRTQAEAGARLAEDDESMAAAGYALASQEWVDKIEYGLASKIWFAIGAVCTAGGWLIAPPLSLVAMVFLVIGVLTRTRTGTLTATWTRAGASLNGAGSRPRR
jgi:hypothetical protein